MNEANCRETADVETGFTMNAVKEQQVTITQTKASARYGVSTRTLHRWEQRGKIVGTKVDGLKMYPVKDLDRLVGVNQEQR